MVCPDLFMGDNQKIWLWAVSPENYKILKEKLVWASSNQDRIRKLEITKSPFEL